MYAPIEIDKEEFMLRPMTCPHHFELYLRKPVSYRELPMRIAELAKLYRYEQSGEIAGLERVRTFCLADAHIICASENQAGEEISSALDLIEYIAGVFGLKQGDPGATEPTTGTASRSATARTRKNILRTTRHGKKARRCSANCSKSGAVNFVEAAGEAAFYGPKIDIQMKNVNGKENTAFTVQYDFCMPERFDLTYISDDGSKKPRLRRAPILNRRHRTHHGLPARALRRRDAALALPRPSDRSAG